jgi:hypothetical protein
MSEFTYQQKPRIVEARQYTARTVDETADLAQWCGGVPNIYGLRLGERRVAVGEWVVKFPPESQAGPPSVRVMTDEEFHEIYERPDRIR